jgi:hypothetical protein
MDALDGWRARESGSLRAGRLPAASGEWALG